MSGDWTAVLLVVGIIAALLFVVPALRRKPVTPPPGTPTVPPDQIKSPVAFPAFVVGLTDWMNMVYADFRYREHGCEAGTGQPIAVSGAYDPNGLPLEHFIEITGPNRDGSKTLPYAAFATMGNAMEPQRVDGKWVTFPTIRNPNGKVEQDALVGIIIGNSKDNPGHPVILRSCPTPTPTPVPTTIPAVAGFMEIRYRVRNTAGKEASGVTRLPVYSQACDTT